MLYVQQSLGPDEDILVAARFHWMYTMKAMFWVVFGISIGVLLAYGGIWLSMNSDIRTAFPDLPAIYYDQAQAEVLKRRGGYMQILWSLHPAFRIGILVSFVMGLFMFANLMIVKATTEIAVTTERLIFKRGLIARNVGELSVDRIEGVSVLQGIVGRLLGYGRVSIRGMGVGEVILPPIENPIEFRKVVQEARMISEKGGHTSMDDIL